MPDLVVFIDDGGVMSDNRRRAPQWRRLVAEFFPPLLGGAPDAWQQANLVVAERLLNPDAWAARIRGATSYVAVEQAYQVEWLRDMCALVGVPAPPAREALTLARQATAFILPRVDAAIPGAADAVRALHAAGYTLHTASGESSSDLAGYLGGMGIADLFGRLYGPDLSDTFKGEPAYYARIFADAGVAAARALVVDDSPAALGWAAGLGARTVLVGGDGAGLPPGTRHIRALAELPEIIASFRD
jgi:HAD superfamily hydrolase (TIGR01509 family)